MAVSNSSEPIIDLITQRLVLFCQNRGLKPILLIDGVILWLGWVVLTWLAFMASLLFVEVGYRNDVSLSDGLVGGGLVGVAQWLMMRSYVRGAYGWIWVSALSWGMLALLHIGAIGWMAPDTPNLLIRAVFGLFYGGYVGVVLGGGQWWVLRRQVMRAWRWIPLSAGIWAVAIAFGWFIGGGLRLASNLFVSEVVGLMIAWGAIAILSGIGIVGLLFQAEPPKALPPAKQIQALEAANR